MSNTCLLFFQEAENKSELTVWMLVQQMKVSFGTQSQVLAEGQLHYESIIPNRKLRLENLRRKLEKKHNVTILKIDPMVKPKEIVNESIPNKITFKKGTIQVTTYNDKKE